MKTKQNDPGRESPNMYSFIATWWYLIFSTQYLTCLIQYYLSGISVWISVWDLCMDLDLDLGLGLDLDLDQQTLKSCGRSVLFSLRRWKNNMCCWLVASKVVIWLEVCVSSCHCTTSFWGWLFKMRGFFSRGTPRKGPKLRAPHRVLFLYHTEVRTLNARCMFREKLKIVT